MDNAVDGQLRALLRVVFNLREPEEGEPGLAVTRPEGLWVRDRGWLEEVVEAIVGELLLSFDFRVKSQNDDRSEIAEWKQPECVEERTERRWNHRLRIRTIVDDRFEESLAQPDVSPSLRAWKIQIADACADAILDRFHVRPASTGPHATYRRTMYDVGQILQQALGCKTLFLMSGRIAEAKAMEAAIARAYEAVRKLVRELEHGTQVRSVPRDGVESS
jgi:hypothetical protein